MNRDKLLRLIGLFDQARTELARLRELDLDAVLGSRERFAMEQLFYRLGMVCIDLCFHVASRLQGRVPGTCRDCFRVLAEAGIIDAACADILADLAGLRNRIAQVYQDIDHGKLYGYLDELDRLDPFREAMVRLAAGQTG